MLYKQTYQSDIHRTIAIAIAATMLLAITITSRAQCPMIDYLPRSERPYLTERGWDTVVTCSTPEIILEATYWVTARTFNGRYTVEQIPYNPPDPTFCSTDGGGMRIFTDDDDCWAAPIDLPFNFVFFGNVYNRAQVGANGIVSFNTNYVVGDSGICRYSCNIFENGEPRSLQYTQNPHKNAIYGVYDDVDPRYLRSVDINPGIYESIYDTFPCRKLCVSWNGIKGYGRIDNTHYGTWQVVCYEGTNVIEVHIKNRTTAARSNPYATIGIINASGGTAYFPANYNPFLFNITTPEAWRFTPMGDRDCTITWYLGTDTSAATGIVIGSSDTTEVILNELGEAYRLKISPSRTQTYTARLQYISASGINYDLCTHITVGKPTDMPLTIEAPSSLCQGSYDTVSLTYSTFDSLRHTVISWTSNDPLLELEHINDSHQVVLQPYRWEEDTEIETRPVELNCHIEVSPTCSKDTTLTLYAHHLVDSTMDRNVCDNKTIRYRDADYRPGTHVLTITEGVPCPYTVTLNIIDNSSIETYERVTSCLPYTWQDGITYSSSTTHPSIRLSNEVGCDSTVHLHFTYDTTLRARIYANPPHASLEQTAITIADITDGPHTRLWQISDGQQPDSRSFTYHFPSELDSIELSLTVTRGECSDVATKIIHFHKEALYFPNAFTPDETTNQTFGPHGVGILSITIDIYDRRGAQVAHLEGIDSRWNGTNSKGLKCDEGAYTYIARYTNVITPRETLTTKGTVLLIR